MLRRFLGLPLLTPRLMHIRMMPYNPRASRVYMMAPYGLLFMIIIRRSYLQDGNVNGVDTTEHGYIP